MFQNRSLLTFIVFQLSMASFACTNFLVGKAASTDGSTFISYSADSYFLYGALYHFPATDYSQGEMLDIHEWDTGKYLGKIKQVQHTFSVVGNINEHQLSIAETTFGGRPQLVDTTAILDYGSLIYITLQRAKTAREAIKIMTDLVAQYGYFSAGESFSIADPNEVWVMEMVGKGAANKGAVWVAQRIPDDCVSAHANHARISTFPFNDSKNCLYSKDVINFARIKGYFKGKDAEFSFSDTYAPLDYGALRFCEARVWSFFRKINPETEKFISYIKGETPQRLPLWVKPVQKLTRQDIKNYMRDQFEGTELDITQGFGAGAFGSKLRCSPLTFTVDSVEYGHERPTATQQTGFNFVAQMRSWMPNCAGGILWFGVDDAATNLYVPMYCGIDSVPECFRQGNGSLVEYSSTSAFWTYNQVANFAYTKYSYILPDIKKVQAAWEQKFDALVIANDTSVLTLKEKEARSFLTHFSIQQAEESTLAWKKLGEYLQVKYLDGVIKKETDGKFLQNGFGIPPSINRAGYPPDYLRQMVKENPNLKMKTVK